MELNTIASDSKFKIGDVVLVANVQGHGQISNISMEPTETYTVSFVGKSSMFEVPVGHLTAA